MIGLNEEPHGCVCSEKTAADWDAFGELQKLRLATCDSFSLNCLEDASSRLLKNTRRSATGVNLAKNLYRDSRKSSRLLRSKYVPIEDINAIRSPDPDPAQQFQLIEEEQNATRLLSGAMGKLPTRVQLALELKFNDINPSEAANCLRVKERQFRNLVRQGLEDLRLQFKHSGGLQ